MQNYFSIQFLRVIKLLWFTSKKIPLFMRVFILCLICSIGLVHAADTYAQKTVININARNQTVGEILRKIEKESGFDFFFNNKHVDVNRRTSVVLNNSNVFKVLEELFSGTNVQYMVLDNKIILSIKQDIIQKKSIISGEVVDMKGEPIIGASIIEKGDYNNGTATDLNGNFKITIHSDKTELEVSSIGYRTQIVRAVKDKFLTITLQEDTKLLDEVVVVGYGTMKKRDLTGAITSVNMNDQPVNTSSSIAYMLSGKAAGLEISRTTAQPGAKSNFLIRGAGSMNAGNDPLIVVDGFPVSDPGNLGSGNRYSNGTRDNFLSSLNPNDIESIEVLKDASSTAIYGARAGHGVIIITTKKGSMQKPVIKYSGSASIQQISRGYDLLNASEYMNESNRYKYESWLMKNEYYPYGTKKIEDSSLTFIPDFTPEQVVNPEYDTDWIEAITRTGIQTQHNVSVSGGTQSTQYLISGNYLNQKGIFKGNDMERYVGRINLNQQLASWAKLEFVINASRNIFNDVALGDGNAENASMVSAALSFSPLIPIRDGNGDFSMNPAAGTVPNPVSMLDITDTTTKDRFLGNASLILTPLKNLTLKMNLGIDRNHQKRKTYLPKTTLYGSKMGGQASISQSDRSDYLMEFTANYTKCIKRHQITALGGYSYQKFSNEWSTLGNNDFLTDSFLFHNMAAGNAEKPTVGSSAFVDKMASFFARVNYSFMDRYLLTATLRADGSSNFSDNNRWGYFPSVSLGWRISEEPFWKSLSKIVPNAKLRLSYGQTGNANVGTWSMSFYQVGYSTIWGDSEKKGVFLSQLGNPDLKWETTTEWNLGLDLGLFDNRVNITAELYHRVISDLLNTRNLMSYNELTSIMANVGSTQSKGFELTINSKNIVLPDFTWSTDFTFSFYRDKWKERADTWKPAAYNEYVEPLRGYWGYLSDGIIQPGDNVSHMSGALPGQVKIKDIDGFQLDEKGNPVVDKHGRFIKTGKPDGKLDDADKVMYGSKDPGYIVGFNNTFRYKRFDLNFYMYGQFNKLVAGDFYNQIAGLDAFQYGGNFPVTVKDAWAHDNQNGKIPGVAQAKSPYGTGDYAFYKMWFLRMRNITLGYAIPVKKISQFRVYFDVNNPFMFTNYKGFDPETDSNYYAYPNVRSFSLGVDITF